MTFVKLQQWIGYMEKSSYAATFVELVVAPNGYVTYRIAELQAHVHGSHCHML